MKKQVNKLERRLQPELRYAVEAYRREGWVVVERDPELILVRAKHYAVFRYGREGVEIRVRRRT